MMIYDLILRDATEKVWRETGEIWRLNQQWNPIWRSPTESWLWVPWWSLSTICSLRLLRVDLLMKVNFDFSFILEERILLANQDSKTIFSRCHDDVSRAIPRCCLGRSRCNCGRYYQKETTTVIQNGRRGTIQSAYSITLRSRSVLSFLIGALS